MLNADSCTVIAHMTAQKSEQRKKNACMTDRVLACMRSSGTDEIILGHTHTRCQIHSSADPGMSNSGVKKYNDERSPGSNGAFCVWK